MTSEQNLGVLAICTLAGILVWMRWRACFLGTKWFDYLVPWAKPLTDEQKQARQKRIDEEKRKIDARIKYADIDSLERLAEGLSDLLEKDADRRRNVDSRLATMVGLASIAATVVSGLIIAQAAGTLRISDEIGRQSISVLAFYLAVQLCDAICWAIYGQERRSYCVDSVVDFLPEFKEVDEQRLKKRVLNLADQLNFNIGRTNDKVTAMAVAHKAATNFGIGLILLAGVGLAIVPTAVTTTLSAESLRTDTHLQELLRGKTGMQGPPGVPGPPGPIGPPGPKNDFVPSQKNGRATVKKEKTK